jgi:hypothetical protein
VRYDEPVTINYDEPEKQALTVKGNMSVRPPFVLTATNLLVRDTIQPYHCEVQRDLTVAGRTTLGATHSGGRTGGYSFADRGQPYVKDPRHGERWELRAERGAAVLWSGRTQLTVDADGDVTAAGRINTPGVTASGDVRASSVSAESVETTGALKSPAFAVHRVEGHQVFGFHDSWTPMASLTISVRVPVTALILATATAAVAANLQTGLSIRVNGRMLTEWAGIGIAGGHGGIEGHRTYMPITTIQTTMLAPGDVTVDAVVRKFDQPFLQIDVQCGHLIVITLPPPT